jgi:hypothetical protein
MAASIRPRSASLVDIASNGDVCEFDVTFSRGTRDRLGRVAGKAITLRRRPHGHAIAGRGSVFGVTAPDLDAIEADLDAVQTALDRLADGSYWNDEVTGEPIPDDVLETDPLTRRA